MKVVINRCWGGFGLSEAAVLRYFEIKGQPVWVQHVSYGNWYWLTSPENRTPLIEGDDLRALSREERIAYNRVVDTETFNERGVARDDPVLVQVVEELGSAASGGFANLKVIEIPDDIEWEVTEYDGMETVEERHRSWC